MVQTIETTVFAHFNLRMALPLVSNGAESIRVTRLCEMFFLDFELPFAEKVMYKI
jgi:hypothetical protein